MCVFVCVLQLTRFIQHLSALCAQLFYGQRYAPCSRVYIAIYPLPIRNNQCRSKMTLTGCVCHFQSHATPWPLQESVGGKEGRRERWKIFQFIKIFRVFFFWQTISHKSINNFYCLTAFWLSFQLLSRDFQLKIAQVVPAHNCLMNWTVCVPPGRLLISLGYGINWMQDAVMGFESIKA